MKPFYLLILAGIASTSYGQRQGASLLYGYKQQVTPGTMRRTDDGRETGSKTRFNYFIYLASSSKVTPIELWINGEPFSVMTKPVASPVIYHHPNSGDRPEILVPETRRSVWQLTPSAKAIETLTKGGKHLSSKNELVIIYRSGGKLYYKAIPKLSELERVAMQ